MNETLRTTALGVQPRIIPRAEHTISRSNLSGNAVRVLYRLKEAGFQAFLVGGCVRDVMLGRHPKDFDVATNALPDQVRSLFRNSRLVGRRFRLAHVVFGREVIEVATFRAASAPSPSEEPVLQADPEEGEAPELDEESELDDEAELNGIDHERVLDTHGRLLRDNVYGTIDEDVWRRDFTVNSLYYNIADFSLWDYVGGAGDLAAHRLRLIGDPETRYREDPVRMLRAARFEAKLGFTLEASTAEPIPRLRSLMAGVPAARLFDETLKLFLTGHGERSLDVLRQRQLLGELFPAVERYLATHPNGLVEQLLRQGLRNTDARVAEDKPVTPTFLIALLLYGPVAQAIESLPPQRWHELGAIAEACDRTLRAASTRVTIPRRVALGVREMYALQPRLEQPRGKRALRLLEQPRFRSAFDLLMLRAQLGLAPAAIATWWTQLQEADPERRLAMVDSLARPRGAKPAGQQPVAPLTAGTGAAGSAGDPAASPQGDSATDAPRRAPRRRRRRRFHGTG
ncbi:MAG TPA: polynucleotide adenylyltransferase PcnB [Steroidobacteraceae bacterium]|nr:polynucleotide adenylyltransferase PcnB [Steroidobacteraceae bacterium]